MTVEKNQTGPRLDIGQAGPKLRAKCCHYVQRLVLEGLKTFVKVPLANWCIAPFSKGERDFTGRSLTDRGSRRKRKKRHQYLSRLWDHKGMV